MKRLIKTVVKAYKSDADVFFYDGNNIVDAFSIQYPLEKLDLSKTVGENMVDIESDVLDLWRNGNESYSLNMEVFKQEMKKIATIISLYVV